MTKQLQDIKVWMEQVEKVSTNILNKTDLTTGKRLTPVELNKYHNIGGMVGLNRQQVEDLLINGFKSKEEVTLTPEKKSKEVVTLTPEKKSKEVVTLTFEQQYRIEFLAKLDKWILESSNAHVFSKRQEYKAKWMAKNP